MRRQFLARAASCLQLSSCNAKAATLPPTTALVAPPPAALVSRLASRLIPAQAVPRPITNAERQYFLRHGLIRPNDSTWQTLRPVHAFRAGVAGRPPFYRDAAPMAGPSNSGADLNYYSGQVLVNPVVIPVFWGFGAVQGVPNPSRDPRLRVDYLADFAYPSARRHPTGCAALEFTRAAARRDHRLPICCRNNRRSTGFTR